MKQTFASTLAVVLSAAMLALSACRPAAPSATDASVTPVATDAAVAAVQEIAPAAYQTQFVDAAQAHLLVDVRTPEEFATGHIPGAVNIPLQEMEARLAEVPTDSPVIVYCRSGNRSAQAADLLHEAGYTQIYDLGGINAWQAQGLPVQ